jgi:iron complex outermembrane recepter protein
MRGGAMNPFVVIEISMGDDLSGLMQRGPVRLGMWFLVFLAITAPGWAQTRPVTPTEPILYLDDLKVDSATEDERYDSTGMGSVEEQLRDEPFSNSLIDPADYTVSGDSAELNAELVAVAETSPADRIAGDDRLNLRGFPTPALRNSFIQIGIPETLNTNQTIVIQGALVPVLGRGAPGGIQNFMTSRPRTKAQVNAFSSYSDLDRQRVSLEYTSPLLKKRFWQRVAVEWQRRSGPEQFSLEETRTASAALTWRHSKAASTLFSLDFRQIDGRVTPGIPEYRIDATQRIAGPYLPLALFNANGPDAGVHRRSAAAGLQFDSQPSKAVAIRASLEGWRRSLTQDRFTNSVLNLATGLFEGTREPRHLVQPQEALAAQLEGTIRFRGWGAEQKFMTSASTTWGRYSREERSLTTAERNALPLDVRRFDPYAPNFFRPEFDPITYGKINTDRDERARYSSVEASDRLAWQQGRWVVTAGLRYDEVDLEVADRKPGAAFPLTSDRTAQISYHGGLNHQLLPGKLLVFANSSTAFDPSTPVDARTGRIQENETTLGYEAGLRGRAKKGVMDYSVSGFLLYNRHISRRNPLYNDPVADANLTQPQLVASGEERFTGARMEVRVSASPTLNLSIKGVVTRAVTTASPDLPQEIGSPITRLPAFTLAANLRHRPPGKRSGYVWGAGWQYIGGYVVNFADTRRDFLQYPGYGLASLNAGYQWRWAERQLLVDATVRNAGDRDLLGSNARVGAGRELVLSARYQF